MTSYVYRMSGYDVTLLYIGLTDRIGPRMASHAADQWWWDEVASVTWERHPDRATARDAERRAIETDLPLHNKLFIPAALQSKRYRAHLRQLTRGQR